MGILDLRLPGYRITHDTSSSLLISWNKLVCGARKHPHDGTWIVAVHDVSEDDLDSAPSADEIASSRDEALGKLCDLAERMIALRPREGTGLQDS